MFTAKVIVLNLDKSLADALAQRRAETGVPTSEYIRRCVRYALEHLSDETLAPPFKSIPDSEIENAAPNTLAYVVKKFREDCKKSVTERERASGR
jgi:hypothetical protein